MLVNFFQPRGSKTASYEAVKPAHRERGGCLTVFYIKEAAKTASITYEAVELSPAYMWQFICLIHDGGSLTASCKMLT